MSFQFKSGPRRTFKEERIEVNVVYGSSSGFPSPSNDIADVQDRIVDENAPWHLRDLTSKDDGGPSDSQFIQSLSRHHYLSVTSDVQAVQVLIKDALAALGSSRNGVESWVEQKMVCESSKRKSKAFPKSFESRPSDAQ